MNILLLADEPSKSLWDFYDETKLKGVDLILSAGDLPPAYLSFLVTFSNCPLLYVHGNHDDIYDVKPPEGCICIDDQIYVHEGIRILGLGGSMRYNNGPHPCADAWLRGSGRPAAQGLFQLSAAAGPLQTGLYGARTCAYELRIQYSPCYRIRQYPDYQCL